MSTDNPAQQVLTDDQLEDCWTRAEQDAESPEDEWLLYGRYVERAALAAAPQPAQEPVGKCLTREEAARTDGRAGPFIWWGNVEPGAYLYAGAAPTQAAPVAELVEALKKTIVYCDLYAGGTAAEAAKQARAALARYEGTK